MPSTNEGHFYLLVDSGVLCTVQGKEVAERLAALLRDERLADAPTANIEVVDEADLGLAARVSYREGIGVLEDIESVGDWDHGIWADSGLRVPPSGV